jgi:hypothetical protein
MQPLYEFLTGSELRVPYVEIIESRIVLFLNPARQVSDGADPESLPLFSGCTDLKSAKLEHFEMIDVEGSTGKPQLFNILQYIFRHPTIPAINLEHFAVGRDESGAQTVNHLFFFRPIVQTEKTGHFFDLLRTA